MLNPQAILPLPLGAIRPTGWLQRQLRIQADGLSGHLHEFWPDIRDSGWIGGEAEGWERVPYWLDGLVPLAVALGDEHLLAVAKRYIDHILDHQHPDGRLAPQKHRAFEDRDIWPVFIVLKVLTQWHEATDDPRVIPAMQRALEHVAKFLPDHPLVDWGKSRWADLVVSIHWLYDRTGDDRLLELAQLVRSQGYDWPAHFASFHFFDRITDGTQQHTHVVNNAMAVKTPGVWLRQSNDPRDRAAVYQQMEMLDRYHGQATGVFSGDEHYAGKSPSQGTETCAVVEYLYSLEVLLAVLGDPILADRLEQIAFNALPAAFTDDMWARQYDQQVNQVLCRNHEDRPFATNGPAANNFGIETNFGCCTADMHQGWPKFVSHLWMATPEGGLAAVAYAPCSVTGPNGVNVEVVTDYPFNETVEITVTTQTPATFELLLRIPAWATDASVDGQPAQPGTFHRIERAWSGRQSLELKFPMAARLERRLNHSATIHRGPLVFALPVGECWKPYGNYQPRPDCEVFPTSPWNYALDVSEQTLSRDVRFETAAPGDKPFTASGAPVKAVLSGRRLPEWVLIHNAADVPPHSPATSDQPPEELTLIPYGCPKLRITEFPTLR